MVSRRDFLKQMSVFSLAAPMMAHAPLALASSSNGRSKALVYVMLDGGNDSANMVIPLSDAHYQTYYDLRPDLAVSKDVALPIPASGFDASSTAVQLGLHPKMTHLAQVFNNQEASVIVNSGILKEPLTKLQAETEGFRLPPFLFSHNSQKNEWAKGAVGHNLTTGWAGRLMDVLSKSSTELAPLFSHAGDSQLLRGQTFNQNIIRGENIAKFNANATTVEAMDEYFNQPQSDPFSQTVSNIGLDAIHVADRLITIINSFDDDASAVAQENEFYLDSATGKESNLATQFRITSRLIQKSAELVHNTQVFFLKLAGFDTHADQDATLNEKYAELSFAMAAFNNQLKALGLHDDVLTVTMSDFGRRIPANGTGTDHGWGGHQLIMGGAVNAARFIGTWPDYTVEGPDTVERGRLLPSIAADQVNISLARWLGASQSAIEHAFPNHRVFAPLNITTA